jgi:hypothetical protein
MSAVTCAALQTFRAVVAAACLMLGPSHLEAAAPPAEPAHDDSSRPNAAVDQVLDHLGRLAELYRDQALQFTCDERIDYEDRANKHEIHDFEYIYVYDESRGFLEYRTLPHAGVKKGAPPAEIDPAMYRLPTFVRRAYSWIFIFEPGKRKLYRYTLEGRELVHGRQALRLRFDPILPYDTDLNDWVGMAWVDEEDSQLLRIEAQKVDQRARKLAYERLLSGVDPIEDHAGEPYSFMEIATEFKEQKNDLAFPDATVTTRRHCEAKPGKHGIKSTCWPVYSVTQTYTNYRFFSIRTRDEIRAFLSGGPAPTMPPTTPPPGDPRNPQ